jgi:5-hydroxyisourate hydrolase-like protein (transthyretin family)
MVLLTALLVLVGGPALAAPAERDEPVLEPGLHLAAPPAYADGPALLTISLADAEARPVAGSEVRVERRTAGTWADLAVVTTGTDGTASLEVPLARDPADNAVRASAGDGTGDQVAEAVLPLRRRNASVVVTGPDEVVDETSTRLAVRWATGAGEPLAGEVVLERLDLLDGRWRPVERLTTDERGRAETRVAPREDARYRVRTPRSPWLERGTSRVHRVDNTPPGTVVRLAGPAPRRTLPRAERATEDGPAAVVSRVPGAVWRSMVGRTWHSGCPVGRDGLRLLRINYWGYDGYRYRGELVAAASVVGQVSAALADMYRAQLPIRAMVRPDRFGWSARVRGADDYASMAAGNTSAFNCRDVVGRPGTRSPHAWGRALDLNTWENPYRSAQGLVPNSWWQSHSHPRVAWRSSSHRVVAIMRRHGLRWTYGLGDTQHFDAVPRSASRGGDDAAPVLPRVCERQVCD